MSQQGAITSIKRHPIRCVKTASQLRMAVALLALPFGLLALLPKSALAAAPMRPLEVRHSTVVVRPYVPHSHQGQEQAAAKRTVIRYEEARRAAQRKHWSQAWGNGARQEAMT